MKNKASKGVHAIVIGGSMAGLVTARVLTDHFDRVTLIEKDELPDAPVSRKGVPQGRHLHALLAGGRTVLERFYPGLTQSMVQDGAITDDMGATTRWYHYGDYKKQFTSGLQAVLMSRPLIEYHVRKRTLALPNLILLPQTGVKELLTDASRSRVTGVRLENRQSIGETQELQADLVVDTSGRGSQTPRWLTALGYEKPTESEVKVNVGYATRTYRRQPGDLTGAKLILISPVAPHDKRAGLIFPIEGDRWIVTLAGWLGDYCPADEAGFLAYTKSLCAPDLYNMVKKLEPISDIVLHRFPSSLRRHYEKMKRFPENFLVLGDAICSFNPTFGQGMTSASLQAQALENCLRSTDELTGIYRNFFRQAAAVIDIPWQSATGEDFRYPAVEGPRPPEINIVNRYVTAVHRAVHRDEVVYKAFLEVMNLMRPPQSLMRPAILFRVLKDVLLYQRKQTIAVPVREDYTNQPSLV